MKKKLLLPIDGSDRDSITINYVKDNFDPKETEVALMSVGEIVYSYGLGVPKILEDTKKTIQEILDQASNKLEGFECKKEVLFGYAAREIVRYAKDNKVDMIIMAKHTKKMFAAIVGSVTAEVLKKTNCVMTILPQGKTK